VSDRNNVIPFRRPPPSQTEIEVYRQMTKNWNPVLRREFAPENFRREQEADRARDE
jgi:hypothetical protein